MISKLQNFLAKIFSSSSSENCLLHSEIKILRKLFIKQITVLRNCISFSGKPLKASTRLICSKAFAYLETESSFFKIVIAFPKKTSEVDTKVNNNEINFSFGTKVCVEYPHHDFAQLNASK